MLLVQSCVFRSFLSSRFFFCVKSEKVKKSEADSTTARMPRRPEVQRPPRGEKSKEAMKRRDRNRRIESAQSAEKSAKSSAKKYEKIIATLARLGNDVPRQLEETDKAYRTLLEEYEPLAFKMRAFLGTASITTDHVNQEVNSV